MALYEKTIRLKGFLGKDAETKTARNGNTVTVLSLATKSSYKDKQADEWVSRTEWHRIVCFNKAAEYAKVLKNGEYIDGEGELRSSEFDNQAGEGKKEGTVKRRSWEVRATMVRKLVRIENHDTEPVTKEGAA